MNKNLAIAAFVLLVVFIVGVIPRLLPSKGDADQLENIYTITISNCSIATQSETELKALFSATEYRDPDGGVSYLSPIIKVDVGQGKQLSFGIPIYGVNYWRYKWVSRDLYVFDDRVEDQDVFWEMNRKGEEHNFDFIQARLSRENTVTPLKIYDFYVDQDQPMDITGRSVKSLIVLKQVLDKKISSGEIKKSDNINVLIKCANPTHLTETKTDIETETKSSNEAKLPSPPKERTIVIQTEFSRTPKQNQLTWSKSLAEKAESLILKFRIKGKKEIEYNVTKQYRYDYNPGNEGQGIATDVTLEVRLDKSKYSLNGKLKLTGETFNCSAN